MPGTPRGSPRWTKICQAPAPSKEAASVRADGMAAKKTDHKENGKRGNSAGQDNRPDGIHQPQTIQHKITGNHGHLKRHQHQYNIQRVQYPFPPKPESDKSPGCRRADHDLSGHNGKDLFAGVPEHCEKPRRVQQ